MAAFKRFLIAQIKKPNPHEGVISLFLTLPLSGSTRFCAAPPPREIGAEIPTFLFLEIILDLRELFHSAGMIFMSKQASGFSRAAPFFPKRLEATF